MVDQLVQNQVKLEQQLRLVKDRSNSNNNNRADGPYSPSPLLSNV